MATPTIGGIQFAAMQGRVTPIAMVSEDHSRPGVSGHELYEIGKRGALSQLQTVADFDSAVDAAAHLVAGAALQGEDLVTVTYADGTSSTNVAIDSVAPAGGMDVATAVIGGLTAGAYIVRLNWTVHQAEG